MLARFALCTALVGLPLFAQLYSLNTVLNVTPPENVAVKKGQSANFEVRIDVKDGYHVNSNKPEDPYLIPLKLTWTPGTVEGGDIVFPKPVMKKLPAAENPMSLYEGTFRLTSSVKAPASVAGGPQKLIGKLRYQSCSDKMCLPPKTIDVVVPVSIAP